MAAFGARLASRGLVFVSCPKANFRRRVCAVQRGCDRAHPSGASQSFSKRGKFSARPRLRLENYGTTLNKTKEELKTQVVPLTPLAPNEFQSRSAPGDLQCRLKEPATNRVKLPENFHLGFDEFTPPLPDTAASPLLGQQLGQVELLVNILIDNSGRDHESETADRSTGPCRLPIPVTGKPREEPRNESPK